jgi:hypothetical protein
LMLRRWSALVAVLAGSAHARVKSLELRALDLATTQCHPHRRQRVTGSQQEGVRILIGQVLTDRGPGTAKHHHWARYRVRVDLPGGSGLRAILGEVTHDLRRSSGTHDRHGEITIGCVSDDDEQRGLLAIKHECVDSSSPGR